MKFHVKLLLISSLLLAGCKTVVTKEKYEAVQYSVNQKDSAGIDQKMVASLRIYKDSLNKLMNVPLIFSSGALVKGNPESALGNFVADACKNIAEKICEERGIARADIIMFNNGGLRTSLPAGQITVGNIYELMPFENQLVIVRMPPVITAQLFKYIAAKNGNPVAGIKFKIQDSAAINILIDGQPLDDRKDYRLLTSDYLSNGGDNLDFLVPLKKEYLSIKMRDALLNELSNRNAQGDTLNPTTDGRIYK